MTFEDLLDTVKTVNSKDRARKLGDAINDEVTDALQRVNQYRKKAEITLKIQILPEDRNEVNIIADINKKVPKGTVKQNLFYQDSKGDLFEADPSQLKLINSKEVENISKRRNVND